MANRLNWSQGKWGRGNIYRDGSIETWPGDDDRPGSVAQFHITPEGGVHGLQNNSGRLDHHLVADICKADHGLFSSMQGDHTSTIKVADMGAMHAELKVPKPVREKIRKWVDELEWPEGSSKENRDEYHITILTFDEHSEEFIEWMKKEMKGHGPFEFISEGLDVLGEAVVLRLSCPSWRDLAIEWGDTAYGRSLGPRRFPGGPKAHVTVGFGTDGKKPRGIQDPYIGFSTSEFNVNVNKTSANWNGAETLQIAGEAGCPRCGGTNTVRIGDINQTWPRPDDILCRDCDQIVEFHPTDVNKQASLDDYEIRPADEGWFAHDTPWTGDPRTSGGNFVPRYVNDQDTLTTEHGQGDGRVAYFNGEPVASVTWQEDPNSIMLGSAWTHPDHRGKGLFNALTNDIRASGKPVDAYSWDNRMLREKVRDWRHKQASSFDDLYSRIRDEEGEDAAEAYADYLAAYNEADRDSGELMDVPDEQVERHYENWESEGKPRIAHKHIADKQAAISPTLMDAAYKALSNEKTLTDIDAVVTQIMAELHRAQDPKWATYTADDISQAIELAADMGSAPSEGQEADPQYETGPDGPRLTEGGPELPWTDIPSGMEEQIPGYGEFPGYVDDPGFPARMRWSAEQTRWHCPQGHELDVMGGAVEQNLKDGYGIYCRQCAHMYHPDEMMASSLFDAAQKPIEGFGPPGRQGSVSPDVGWQDAQMKAASQPSMPLDQESTSIAGISSSESFGTMPETAKNFVEVINIDEASIEKRLQSSGSNEVLGASGTVYRGRGSQGDLRETEGNVRPLQQASRRGLSARPPSTGRVWRSSSSSQFGGDASRVSQVQDEEVSTASSNHSGIRRLGGGDPLSGSPGSSSGAELLRWLRSFSEDPEEGSQPVSPHHMNEMDLLPTQTQPTLAEGYPIDPPEHPFEPYNWAEESAKEASRLESSEHLHDQSKEGKEANDEKADANQDDEEGEDGRHPSTLADPPGWVNDPYEEMKHNWYERAWDNAGSPVPFPPQPMHWRHDHDPHIKS